MDPASARRWAGCVIFVNVIGTILSVIVAVCRGLELGVITYASTFAVTALLVFGAMRASGERATCPACGGRLSGVAECPVCVGDKEGVGAIGAIIHATMAARSSSANATKM
jgi:hypothetical protein